MAGIHPKARNQQSIHKLDDEFLQSQKKAAPLETSKKAHSTFH